MNVFTKIALASTGMVEIKRNQAGFILYIQGRANPPRLERFVTLGSFPRWSNILQPLTGGRRNRLTICQIRYKKTNSETVTLSISRSQPCSPYSIPGKERLARQRRSSTFSERLGRRTYIGSKRCWQDPGLVLPMF